MNIDAPKHELTTRRTIYKAPMNQLRIKLYFTLIAMDLLVILTSFALATFVRNEQWLTPAGIKISYLIAPVYIIIALITDVYSLGTLNSASESIKRALYAFTLTTAIVLIVIFFFGASKDLSRLGVFAGLGSCYIFLSLTRKIFADIVRARKGEKLISELVIVDDSDVDPSKYRDCEVVVAAAIGISADVDDPIMMHRLGMLLNGFDRVIVRCPAHKRDNWALVLKGGNVTGEIIQTNLRPLGAIGIGSFHDEDTLIVARGPLSIPSRAQKRALDLAVTVPLIIALSPLLLITALLIKLDTRGPILFRQKRIGRSNQMFDIYKFRSMRDDLTDATGARSAAKDDNRITRVGRIIRRTSIDELPQLFNVLLGDMSLVGPRPHALGSLAGNQLFWQVDRDYWCRHALKPGITGLAQVRGFRGATHRSSDLQNRLEADLEYIVGWTITRDVRILLRTFAVVLHKNAY